MPYLRRHFEQYYEDGGQGIPLICLPAFPFDSQMYAGQHLLAEQARLILTDYRGVGKSSLKGGPYTMELLAEDVFSLLDHLQVKETVVLGVSMGAYVAFSMYDMAPKRILGLVIVDSRSDADNPDMLIQRQKTVEALRSQGTVTLKERVNQLFASSTHLYNPELIEKTQQQVMHLSAEGLAQIILGLAARPDRGALLAKISVPTLVICGEEDIVSPPANMRAMADRIPGAVFHTLPRAGHLSPLEQPEKFNQLVREFLHTIPKKQEK